MCLFLLAGVIYCAEMMRIYRDSAYGVVKSYWKRLDPHAKSSKDPMLRAFAQMRTARIARTLFNNAYGILIACAVFLSLALLASGAVMGLKYTLKRVGAGAKLGQRSLDQPPVALQIVACICSPPTALARRRRHMDRRAYQQPAT